MDGNLKTTAGVLALYFPSRDTLGCVHSYLYDFERDAFIWQGLVDAQANMKLLPLKVGDRGDR